MYTFPEAEGEEEGKLVKNPKDCSPLVMGGSDGVSGVNCRGSGEGCLLGCQLLELRMVNVGVLQF